MRHRGPPRLPGDCYSGAHRVFLTMCTDKRKEYFSDAVIAESIRTQLLSTAPRWHIEIVAYCFMPDHLHLLVEGKSEGADCRTYADAFRRTSGFHFRRERRRRL